MMRKTGIFTILLATFSLTFACGSGGSALSSNKGASTQNQSSYSTTDKMEVANSTTNISAIAADTDAAKLSSPRAQRIGRVLAEKVSLDQTRESQTDTLPTDRKIVRNADLSLESETPEETQRRITSIAENNGGFVVESQQTSSDSQTLKRDTVSMSVRVPSAKFADALDQIRQTSERVIFESVKGDDVTEEFIDIEARLKAKKALEQQFVEIMKRANNVEDALNVQSQLADVRGEIEKIEGRKRFLENQTSLSTIKIKLQTTAAFSASSSGFTHKLGESFGTGVDFALSFILGLVTLVVGALPFIVFIGLPTFFILRYFWKRQNSPKTVIEIVKEELDAT